LKIMLAKVVAAKPSERMVAFMAPDYCGAVNS